MIRNLDLNSRLEILARILTQDPYSRSWLEISKMLITRDSDLKDKYPLLSHMKNSIFFSLFLTAEIPTKSNISFLPLTIRNFVDYFATLLPLGQFPSLCILCLQTAYSPVPRGILVYRFSCRCSF